MSTDATIAAKIYLARNLTNDEFNVMLADVIRDRHGADATIIDVPGVYEALADYYAIEMMRRHMAVAA